MVAFQNGSVTMEAMRILGMYLHVFPYIPRDRSRNIAASLGDQYSTSKSRRIRH